MLLPFTGMISESTPAFVITHNNCRRAEAMRNRMANVFRFCNWMFVETDNEGDADFLDFVHGTTFSCGMHFKYVANFYDHILCMKHFAESGEQFGLVMEDDCMLHKNFFEKASKTLEFVCKNLRDFSHRRRDCVLFAPYVTKPFSELVFLSNNIADLEDGICGASCYIVSRDYALDFLQRFGNRRYAEIGQTFGTDTETSMQKSKRFVFSHPPLAIEEAIDSNIQDSAHMIGKKNYWDMFSNGNFL